MKRARKASTRWRPLNDGDDLEHVLRELGPVGLNLNASAKQELMRRINDAVDQANKDDAPVGTSSEYTKQMRKIMNNAARLQDSLRACPHAEERLASAADFLFDHPSSRVSATRETLREKYPDCDDLTQELAHRHGITVPSAWAKGEILNMRAYLAFTEACAAKAIQLEARRVAQGGPGVRQPGKRPDISAHFLVISLASTFSAVFNLPATATRGSAFYRFLSAVFARSEGKALDDDKVHARFLAARKDAVQRKKAVKAILAGGSASPNDKVSFRDKNNLH